MNGSFCVCSPNEICFNFHFIFALCSRNKEQNFFLLIKLHSSKSVGEKNAVAFPSFRNCIHSSFSWCCWSFDVWCFQLHYIKLFSVTCKQTQRKREKKRICHQEERKRPKAAVTRVVPFYMNAFGVCKRFYCNPCVELEKLRWTTEHLGQKEMGDDESGKREEKAAKIRSNAIVFTTRRLVEVCVAEENNKHITGNASIDGVCVFGAQTNQNSLSNLFDIIYKMTTFIWHRDNGKFTCAWQICDGNL